MFILFSVALLVSESRVAAVPPCDLQTDGGCYDTEQECNDDLEATVDFLGSCEEWCYFTWANATGDECYYYVESSGSPAGSCHLMFYPGCPELKYGFILDCECGFHEPPRY